MYQILQKAERYKLKVPNRVPCLHFFQYLHTFALANLAVLVLFYVFIGCFVFRFHAWPGRQGKVERLWIRSCYRQFCDGIFASTRVDVSVSTKLVTIWKWQWTAAACPRMTVNDVREMRVLMRTRVDGGNEQVLSV